MPVETARPYNPQKPRNELGGVGMPNQTRGRTSAVVGGGDGTRSGSGNSLRLNTRIRSYTEEDLSRIVAELTSGSGVALGDHALTPSVRAFDATVTDGWHHVLSSAGALMTPQGLEAIGEYHADTFKLPFIKYATTATWNILKARYNGVKLPHDKTADSLTEDAVKTLVDKRNKAGSKAVVLLATRTPRDSDNGRGRLSSSQTQDVLAAQCDSLVNAAKNAGLKDGEYVLLAETIFGLDDAADFTIVTNEKNYPRIMSARPNLNGDLGDGNSWEDFADAIKGPGLRKWGVNCRDIHSIIKAWNKAKGMTYAGPNGANGVDEELGRELNPQEARKRNKKNIGGIVYLCRNGADTVTGCCGTLPEDIIEWGEALLRSGIIFQRGQAGQQEQQLLYEGAGAR